MTVPRSGTIHSLQLSGGGVPKRAVRTARIEPGGLAGDVQRDLRVHGGPDRAVCLFSLERLQALVAEGHPITPGSTGENVTLAGLPWDEVVPGARLRLGAEVLLEVTKYCAPCRHIRASFLEERFERMSQQSHPGWSRVYARVLAAGEVAPGDVATLAPAD